MAEVVTAVACEECDAIVMVTIVLLVICVCGTEPEQVGDRFLIFLREDWLICTQKVRCFFLTSL